MHLIDVLKAPAVRAGSKPQAKVISTSHNAMVVFQPSFTNPSLYKLLLRYYLRMQGAHD